MTERAATSILVAVALPLVALSIDFSGVAVALPQIGADFGVSAAPETFVIDPAPLPRNANGKLVKTTLRARLQTAA